MLISNPLVALTFYPTYIAYLTSLIFITPNICHAGGYNPVKGAIYLTLWGTSNPDST